MVAERLKILEQSIPHKPEIFRKKFKKEINRLKKKYSKFVKGYGLVYKWQSDNLLFVKSNKYNLAGEVSFSPKKITIYITEIPLLFKPFLKIYQSKIKKTFKKYLRNFREKGRFI